MTINSKRMQTLHLFAGAGGGILADLLLGHRPVGAVEIDPFCRKVLYYRQQDGWLPKFPIFKDVKTFNGTEIRRRVDMVAGGFPCQDISCAGRRVGIHGSRSGLFFELTRICRQLRPRFIFLENSPNIITRGLDVVLGEIAEMGYDAEWVCLPASEVGAWHKRDRWWCLCQRQDGSDTLHDGLGWWESRSEESESSVASDSDGERLEKRRDSDGPETAQSDASDSSGTSSDTKSKRRPGRRSFVRSKKSKSESSDSRPFIPDDFYTWYRWLRPLQEDSADGEGWDSESGGSEVISCGEWWHAEPGMGRVASGVANRVDRIKALGNGQVPLCAAVAQVILMRRLLTKVR